MSSTLSRFNNDDSNKLIVIDLTDDCDSDNQCNKSFFDGGNVEKGSKSRNGGERAITAQASSSGNKRSRSCPEMKAKAKKCSIKTIERTAMGEEFIITDHINKFNRRAIWDMNDEAQRNCNNNTKNDTILFDEWLEVMKPSRVSSDECAWIQVMNKNPNSPGYESKDEQNGKSIRSLKPYKRALDTVTNIIQTRHRVTFLEKQTCIKELMKYAKEDGYTVGKWMIFYSPNDPSKCDEQWEKIARATVRGELGCSAKIAPLLKSPSLSEIGKEKPTTTTTVPANVKTSPWSSSSSNSSVCCVYVKDCTDKEEVQRVLMKLVNDLGCHIASGFKPDLFTDLGIYAKNEWRLPPCLYSVREVMRWQL